MEIALTHLELSGIIRRLNALGFTVLWLAPILSAFLLPIKGSTSYATFMGEGVLGC